MKLTDCLYVIYLIYIWFLGRVGESMILLYDDMKLNNNVWCVEFMLIVAEGI
jgi:hypothetical protein